MTVRLILWLTKRKIWLKATKKPEKSLYKNPTLTRKQSAAAIWIQNIHLIRSLSENRHAHATCLAVADLPGQDNFNPLFLYGNSGLGKTHLMQSIAHYILQKDDKTKVLYVPSETFTHEIIDAIKNHTTNEFRENTEMWTSCWLMTFNLSSKRRVHRRNFSIRLMNFIIIRNRLFFLPTSLQRSCSLWMKESVPVLNVVSWLIFTSLTMKHVWQSSRRKRRWII